MIMCNSIVMCVRQTCFAVNPVTRVFLMLCTNVFVSWLLSKHIYN